MRLLALAEAVMFALTILWLSICWAYLILWYVGVWS